MDYKNNKITDISKIEFYSILHDCVVGKIYYKNESLSFDIWNDFKFIGKPKYNLNIPLNGELEDCMNIYNYKFVNYGDIQGNVNDCDIIFDDSFKFQIIDIGYMYNTIFFKGSIIDSNGNSDRNYIIIEIAIEENFDKLILKAVV